MDTQIVSSDPDLDFVNFPPSGRMGLVVTLSVAYGACGHTFSVAYGACGHTFSVTYEPCGYTFSVAYAPCGYTFSVAYGACGHTFSVTYLPYGYTFSVTYGACGHTFSVAYGACSPTFFVNIIRIASTSVPKLGIVVSNYERQSYVKKLFFWSWSRPPHPSKTTTKKQKH